MGLFERSRRARQPVPSPAHAQGDDELEVVGESYYQCELLTICECDEGTRVRQQIVAVLCPEPENPFDTNATAVRIEGRLVGYLPRDLAERYGPGLRRLMDQCGGHVALPGVISGGGWAEDGPRYLGVFLRHDRRAFDQEHPGHSLRVGPVGTPVSGGSMRTGFSAAWLTDPEDDSYDLSWRDLPDDPLAAIERLQVLLARTSDPMDRHFMFVEMEKRLYRCRQDYESALDDYDVACERHDAEMDGICMAMRAKWAKVPLLDTYRQMAIRRQKQKDWHSVLWWAERGLGLYGDDAIRKQDVDDLRKRSDRARVRLGS